MGLINLCDLASQFDDSRTITQPLVERIITQNTDLGDVHHTMKAEKAKVRRIHSVREKETLVAVEVSIASDLKRSRELAAEKGASSWLTCKPQKMFGFMLSKGAFHDAVSLRYGWPLKRLPSVCSCGKSFTVAHALSCSTGGYPSLRHNEVRDLTASIMTEVAHQAVVEPLLEPLTGERMTLRSASTEATALAVPVLGSRVWGGRYECSYFDVRVFNPHAPTNAKFAGLARCVQAT